MNKKIFLLILIMTFFLPCMFSCSKRDKLTTNTMVVSIEPKADIEMSNGESKSLSAIVRNAKRELINPENVSWSVVDSDGETGTLGLFDNPKKVNVIFTATNSGTGKIVLTCEGIQTSVNLSVN
jgi:hypothetical protein